MKPVIVLWIACFALIPPPALGELCDNWPASPSGLSDTDGDVEAAPAGAPGTGYVFDFEVRQRRLADAPYLKLGLDAEPWLPRLVGGLERNRPEAFTPGLVALMAGLSGEQYLVVKWDEPDGSLSTPWPMEIHRVTLGADGRQRLKWVRTYKGERARLCAPSGRVIFRGEAPVAVLLLAPGGSDIRNTSLRLIQMTRSTVDITPDWAGRLIDVVDLDGDGAYEAVMDNSPWNLEIHPQSVKFFPFVPVILARRGGRFVHACRDFAGAYDRFIRGSLMRARRRGHLAATALSEAFFSYLQIGAFAEARALLDEFETAMGYFLADFAWTGRPDTFPTPEQIRDDHRDVFEAIVENPEAACPASMPGLPAGRNGYLRRFGEPRPGRPPGP